MNTHPILSLLLVMTGAGMALSAYGQAETSPSIIEWECDSPHPTQTGKLTDARIGELESHVRAGGGLLIGLGKTPGTSAFRLARLAPTTAWNTLMPAANRGGALAPAESDPDSRDPALFPGPMRSIQVPWRWDIRPVHAVERGIGRYERFEHPAPYTGESLSADFSLWTRPLENRDWRVRLRTSRADDPYGAPLLLTGRFGNGRVAVWASSLESLKSDPETYAAIQRWLSGSSLKSTKTLRPLELAGEVVVDSEKRVLRFTLRNPNPNTAVQGEAVGRFLTWERALVDDSLSKVDVPPGASVEYSLPFPKAVDDAITGYAALVYRDEFVVRLGVVGSDGRLAFPEQRIDADLRPRVRVDLSLDSLRTLNNQNYPFVSAGPDILFYPLRMGAQTMRYAYRPGEMVHVTATVADSLADIGEQAVPLDATTPDNPSVSGLNDGAIQNEKTPRAGFQAWNTWRGVPGKENRVTLTLPRPRTLRAVALHLQPDAWRNLDDHNPASVRIEIDGHEVASADDLDARAVAENGRVVLSLPPDIRGREVRLIFPWTTPKTPRDRARREPAVGEVELFALDEGSRAKPAEGEFVIRATESLTGVTKELHRASLTLSPGEQHTVSSEFQLPSDTEVTSEQFWQIDTLWRGEVVRTVPLLVTRGEHALTSLDTLRPKTAVNIGFIVTRGFRNVFDIGTGTREMTGGWGTPDDLVWAYSHKMKQTGTKARSVAGALYVNDSDFRHYSTPWISFPDGENFYSLAVPRLLARAKADRNWADADRVILNQSDRWDSGPAMEGMYTWTNFMEFDTHLRAEGLPGLTGRTRTQIVSEILNRYDNRWQAWHLDRYLATLHLFRSTFAAEGKSIYILAQGFPLVPTRAESDVGAVIQGMSDDSTWGMEHESVPYTTGRQLGHLAINPSYRMSTLLQWGWNSAVINNPLWFSPVGTTEASRRHYYDRAWLGLIDPAEGYRSMHTFSYNQNGYASWTMSPEDWQEWWRLHERHALFTPDAPIGLGIVRSTDQFNAPETALFGGGGMGGDAAQREVRRTAVLFERLHEAGLGPAFAANAANIDGWPAGASMAIVNPAEFSDSETAALARWVGAGGRVVAFHDPADGPLPSAMAAIFAGSKRPGGPLLIPVAADRLSYADIGDRLAELRATLKPPLEFPAGTMGYGFKRGALNYAVVEDWAERARTVELRIHLSADVKDIHATSLNDHRSLAVRRETDGTWIVSVPLRSGDGEVVVWSETTTPKEATQ